MTNQLLASQESLDGKGMQINQLKSEKVTESTTLTDLEQNLPEDYPNLKRVERDHIIHHKWFSTQKNIVDQKLDRKKDKTT